MPSSHSFLTSIRPTETKRQGETKDKDARGRPPLDPLQLLIPERRLDSTPEMPGIRVNE